MHFSSDAVMISFQILNLHGNKFAAFAFSEDFLTWNDWLIYPEVLGVTIPNKQ